MHNGLLWTTVLLGAYLFAAIPWGLLIGRLKGVDIRQCGSGNIGATNVRRVLGKGWGRLCFALDFLKGLLPVLAVKYLVRHGLLADPWQLAEALTALVCVVGHVASVYLRFQGGRGISTTFGVMLALAPWSLVLTALAWVAVFYSSRYVSLASICATGLLPFVALTLSLTGIEKLTLPVVILLFILAVLTVYKHRSNIQRLRDGTESRFGRAHDAGEQKS